jgi:hypothetical protein
MYLASYQILTRSITISVVSHRLSAGGAGTYLEQTETTNINHTLLLSRNIIFRTASSWNTAPSVASFDTAPPEKCWTNLF